ncbi:alkaline phosphatase [Nodularia harveyana UHCC-0300]|uniref:Alkaline phosphatase n=1 Tax=Nodularia harveyana UHCC-0300 TaxID=2974287 RepID=A0ABU5UII5_9CYAN|nr:alkaline phosphatase [Nodularia harveyana]MEA5583315.1 alkaline phosphatase [Nodularia harveyana UHCC-0300]
MAQNVILVIGDGMGWEMSRAGAIHEEIIKELADLGYDVTTGENTSGLTIDELKAIFADRTLADYYTEGQGFGQSYQELLDGYTIVTDANTVIDGNGSNSLIDGSIYSHNTGEGPIRTDENGNPLEFIPKDVSEGGNVPIFNLTKGGATPWDANYYENYGNTTDGFDPEYIKEYYPDSAGTGTAFHTGTKTYVGAIGVDIYEQDVESTIELALDNGFAAGVVSSVPWSHATPAAGIAHTSGRNKTNEERNIDSYWTTSEAIDSEGNERTLYSEDADGTRRYARYGLDEDGNLLDEFGHIVEETDNIFDSAMEVKPSLILGAGHPAYSGNERYITQEDIDLLKAGEYDSEGHDWNFIERQTGVDGGQALIAAANSIDPDNGEHLFGVYSATGQDNLPWRTANSDYSATGTNGYSDNGRLTGDALAADVLENPNVAEMTEAALDFLGQADKGFYLMVEVGDIDWSAHANNMDLMLGTQLDLSDVVRTADTWIKENGGYDETLLMVTADHDHYLTLLNDFPELLANSLLEDGGASITPAYRGDWEENDAYEVGHFWGSNINDGDQWGTHTSRPIPMYYKGSAADVANIKKLEGTGYTVDGKYVPGVSDFIDQVHIAQVADSSLLETPIITAEENLSQLITGSTGGDTLISGVDFDGINDTVFTGAGNDEVDVPFGGSLVGRNRISTGSGTDTIYVGNGDRSFGGSGNDVIDATDATGYRISGGAGMDTFYLGADGRALGGDGDDKFFVQEGGGNLISGGAGADQFWIVTGDLPMTPNTIVDFEMGTDVLGIASQGADFGFDNLTLTGDSIMIGATTVAMLNGVNTTGLTAADFAFM